MKYVTLLTLLALVGCGKKHHHHCHPTGTITNTETIEVEKSREFKGYFHLPCLSFIELIQRYDGRVDIVDNKIFIINTFDGTVGELPIITGSKLEVVDNKIVIIKDVRSGDYHNIKDIDGNEIKGRRAVELTAEKIDDKLKVTVRIFNKRLKDNPTEVSIEFIITSE